MVTHPNEPAIAQEDGASATGFAIDCVFDAPFHLVWRCLTEQAHVDVWMLPARFTLIEQDVDVSVGGRWWSKIRDQADGVEWHVCGTYREKVDNERLVFAHRWTQTLAHLESHLAALAEANR